MWTSRPTPVTMTIMPVESWSSLRAISISRPPMWAQEKPVVPDLPSRRREMPKVAAAAAVAR